MAFNLKKAREILECLADEPDESAGGDPCMFRRQARDQFPAALDEIERQQGVIVELRKLLIRAQAMNLHWYRQAHEGETRSWEEMPAEEQEGGLWYAEFLLGREHKELFEDVI
jgi:hypothetical protein